MGDGDEDGSEPSPTSASEHLNAGQRAIAALRYEERYAEVAKAQRVATNGGHNDHVAETKVADLPPRKTRDRAATATGASGRAVQQAKALQRDAPDLADKYLSVFSLTIEVVHDEHPEYFGGLLVADIHEAMRVRGCDDATVTGWSWRDPTVPVEDGDDE